MAEEKIRVRCPRCGTIIRWHETPTRPFCSQRCKLIDLGKWIDEEYHIAGDRTPSSQEEGRGEES